MRIPVWSFTWEAFADLGRHWRELLRQGWPFVVVLIAMAAFFRSTGTSTNAGATTGQWLVATSFLFLWCRYLMLGERASLFIGRKHPLAPVWRAYLFGSLRLFAVCILIAAIAGIAAAAAASPVLFALMLLLFPVLGRLGLMLPSAASGGSAKLKDAWALGRGHTLKLTLGTFLVIVPTGVLGVMLGGAQQAFENVGGDLFVFAVWEFLGQTISLLSWAAWGGFLVRCLGLIKDQREPADAVPVPAT